VPFKLAGFSSFEDRKRGSESRSAGVARAAAAWLRPLTEAPVRAAGGPGRAQVRPGHHHIMMMMVMIRSSVIRVKY
jgi:hypothetical protein